jgi:hypothetical protein
LGALGDIGAIPLPAVSSRGWTPAVRLSLVAPGIAPSSPKT